ncbi:hypothetical protein H0H87_005790 [Tephrocybe sp. NHM501043]|nr:hypothetical protein H0H87_005790 [Tephrocybe sp. NHM501043]
MRSLLALCCVSTLLSVFGTASTLSTNWPVHTDGFTDAVEWDHYSLFVIGRRTFVWSGEFHYWRIPVPEIWRDLLEKIKAGGFNTVSIYSTNSISAGRNWAFHAPNNSTVDFETGARNISIIFELAAEVGLFVTLRGGPYVNAETTAGGFALWTLNGEYGTLRNNDPRYTAAWEPYFTRVNEIASQYQLGKGGTIVRLVSTLTLFPTLTL